MALLSRRSGLRSACWLLSPVLALIWLATPSAEAVPPTDLPTVIGMQVDDAVKTLAGIGVQSTTVPDPVPEGVDRSLVLVQDVIDTSVHIDPGPTNSVQLILGSTVPKLSGLSTADATRRLTAGGLAANRVPPDATDSAVVRGQDPAPGALVPLGSPVAITVVSVVAVPDIRGLSASDARDVITQAGLRLTIAAVPPGSTAGQVLEQKPAPGTPVELGSDVQARVAVIPQPPTLISVPNVVGLDSTRAEQVVTAAGLALSATRVGSGTVFTAVQQDPQPGTRVRPGSTVTVRFEARPPPTRHRQFPVAAVGGVAGLMVIVVVIFLIYQQIRANRQRKWVREHISVRAAAIAAAEIALVDRDPASGHTMRLEPHPDPGTQTLQERSP
jgi:beta-lactam-binding protein with PASTA domain